MFASKLLMAVCLTVFSVFPAIACEQHEKKEQLPPSTGRVYFQPDAPQKASEGEIWINAKNGRQLVFIEGEWILREVAAGMPKAVS